MTLALQIILGVSFISIPILIALAICKAGAMADYNMAVLKCQDCKHFQDKSNKYRLIACGNIWKTPEEVMECHNELL